MEPIIWKKLSTIVQKQLLKRPLYTEDCEVKSGVEAMITEVRQRGDAALRALSLKYDQSDGLELQVSQTEFEEARQKMSLSTLKAMQKVIDHLSIFHEAQKTGDIVVQTAPGIVCESLSRPIPRVGLYIPAGTAPLVSTVLMLGVPSQIAGCPTRILCSPPRYKGSIDPHILVAAELCGIQQVYKIGGAQAIAAMAYGTETVPKVDKIFGPGNRWVTQAKMLVAQNPEGAVYDLPAGPSEVMVIADENADPEFVAADLLSQAEHDVDAQVILITTDFHLCERVIGIMNQKISDLSRQKIIISALKQSRMIVVDCMQEALEISNCYAPEHLILQVMHPRQYLANIQSAGSIFLGPFSPESAGDYASGTNHVLPTYGFARSTSGLGLKDFMKTLSVQELTQKGLKEIAGAIHVLSTIEGLDAHRYAVDIRLRDRGI